MLSIWMILAAVAAIGFSGVPACLASSRSMLGQRAATSLLLLGSALGLDGALLPAWNHSLFNSLLFPNADANIHAAHTREIDRLVLPLFHLAGRYLPGACCGRSKRRCMCFTFCSS